MVTGINFGSMEGGGEKGPGSGWIGVFPPTTACSVLQWGAERGQSYASKLISLYA